MDKYSTLNKIRSRWRRLLISAMLSGILILERGEKTVKTVRPRQMFIPVFMVQILLMMLMFWNPSEKGVAQFIVGNLVLVGVAMCPIMVERKKYHFIGADGDNE